MVEAFEQLINALRSGDLQAILAAIALVAVALSPFIGKLVNYKFNTWKAKYEVARNETKKLLDENNKLSEEVKKVLEEMNGFISASQEVTTKTGEMFEYIIQNSTLTDSQKAYAKETYTNAIKAAKKLVITEVENKKHEELPVQPLTEEEDIPQTPSGL